MANMTSVQLDQTVIWLQAVSTQLWILLHILISAQKATRSGHLCCAPRKLLLFEMLFPSKKQTLSLYNALFGSELPSTPTARSHVSKQQVLKIEGVAGTSLASSSQCSQQVPLCGSHIQKQVGSAEFEDSIQQVICEEPISVFCSPKHVGSAQRHDSICV